MQLRRELLRPVGTGRTADASQRGSSIVEIVLITPLLLIALMIPADFGMAMFMANLVQNAAREGARIGADLQKTGGSAPDFNYTTTEASVVGTQVLNRMPANLTSKVTTVRFYEGSAPTCVEYVQVTAQGNYNFFLYQLVRLFGFNAPDSITISRTTQMRYTYQPANNTTPCSTTSINTNYP